MLPPLKKTVGEKKIDSISSQIGDVRASFVSCNSLIVTSLRDASVYFVFDLYLTLPSSLHNSFHFNLTALKTFNLPLHREMKVDKMYWHFYCPPSISTHLPLSASASIQDEDDDDASIKRPILSVKLIITGVVW